MPETLPEHLGLFVLGGGVVFAIVLVAFGVIRIGRAGAALKKRVFAYADVSLATDLRIFSERMAIAERALDRIPVFEARYEGAIAQFAAARDRIAGESRELVRAFRQCYRI